MNISGTFTKRHLLNIISVSTPLFIFVYSSSSWSESIQQLESVEVTDTATGGDEADYEPPQSRFALPQSVEAVQTLTKEDIKEIHPRDVVDLIENSLGLSVRRQGARVHNFSYNRGDDVSIILDGVYLTSTTAQRVLGDIPTESIESVKFVRDSSVITISPLMGFGSANAGTPNQGFIIIKTRKSKPDKKHSTEVGASYATYDTWKTHGFTNQEIVEDTFNMGFGYQHSESNGKPNWNNAYKFDTYLLNGLYESEGLKIDSSVYVNQGWRDIQRSIGIYDGTPPNNNTTARGELSSNIWRYDPMNTLVTALNMEYQWNDNQTTNINLGYSRATGTMYAYYTYTDPSTVSGKEGEDWAKEWTLSHTISSGKNTFKAGLQSVDWYQRSESSTLPNEERVYGLAFSDEYQLSNSVLVDGAIRMDKKKVVHSSTKYLENSTEVKMTEGQWTDDAYVVSMGTAWQVNPTYRLSSRYSFNYTPTPESLTTVDDKSLPAERRHRFEFGVNANLNRAIQLSITPFYYYIENSKVSDSTIDVVDDYGDTNTITVYDVADKEIRKGVEMAVKGELWKNTLSYDLGWSHLYNSTDSDTTDYPDNKYNARINWRFDKFNTSVNALHVNNYMSNDYEVGGFTTINLNISYDITPAIKVSIFGDNITDEEYATMNKGSVKTLSSGKSSPWGVLTDVGETYGIEMNIRF